MRLRIARWLEAGRTPVLVAGAVISVTLVLGRSAVIPSWLVWTGVAVSALTAIVRTGWVARRGSSFLRREAMQRIDRMLRLQDRLAAAAEGAVVWPAFPSALPAIVQWRWGRITAPFVGVALLVLLAVLLPVANVAPEIPTTVAERPPVFAETEQLIEELKQIDAITPAAIEELTQTLEELAARDNEGLYSHGTLEAAAHLRDQTAAGASELAAGLAAAEAAANQLADAATPDARASAQQSLDAALRALADSPLPVNPALAGGFQHSSNGSMANPQQLAEAARRLRNAAGRGQGPGGSTTMQFGKRSGTPSTAAGWRPPSWKDGDGDGDSDGNQNGNGNGRGRGKVSRGPGHPPLELAETPAAARDGQSEALDSADADQAALGEFLSESAGAPRTDLRREAASGSGGTFTDANNHTDAARVDELSPAERRAVRRFFK